MRSPAFAGDQRVTQVFGVNPAAYAHFGLAGHNGVDFGCWTGTELYAPEDGTIVEAYDDAGGYGLTTYLLGTSGRGWRHGHYSRLDVASGDQVRKGQRLGLSGNTGNSTAPHLHLGLRPPNPDRANGFNGYIDPLPTLEWLQEQEEMVTPEQQRILDAAARNGLDDAGIDNMMGINRLLGEQKTSLEELLRTSQAETAAQATEAERLRQLVTAQPSAVDVARVSVTLTDGREVVR